MIILQIYHGKWNVITERKTNKVGNGHHTVTKVTHHANMQYDYSLCIDKGGNIQFGELNKNVLFIRLNIKKEIIFGNEITKNDFNNKKTIPKRYTVCSFVC